MPGVLSQYRKLGMRNLGHYTDSKNSRMESVAG